MTVSQYDKSDFALTLDGEKVLTSEFALEFREGTTKHKKEFLKKEVHKLIGQVRGFLLYKYCHNSPLGRFLVIVTGDRCHLELDAKSREVLENLTPDQRGPFEKGLKHSLLDIKHVLRTFINVHCPL